MKEMLKKLKNIDDRMVQRLLKQIRGEIYRTDGAGIHISVDT